MQPKPPPPIRTKRKAREIRASFPPDRLEQHVRGGFLAVDPGESTGLAWFDNDHELVRVTVADHTSAVQMVREYAGLVVCEVPRVYPVQANTVNPNDLIQLAVKVGQITGNAPRWLTVEPRAWKGSLDKSICAQRALPALSPKERAHCRDFVTACAASYMHNGLDALAIGLWLLARVDFGARSPLAHPGLF